MKRQQDQQEVEDNPNNDTNINTVYDQYFDDLQININLKIEVICDKAIFQRVFKYHQSNSRIQPLLDQ